MDEFGKDGKQVPPIVVVLIVGYAGLFLYLALLVGLWVWIVGAALAALAIVAYANRD